MLCFRFASLCQTLPNFACRRACALVPLGTCLTNDNHCLTSHGLLGEFVFFFLSIVYRLSLSLSLCLCISVRLLFPCGVPFFTCCCAVAMCTYYVKQSPALVSPYAWQSSKKQALPATPSNSDNGLSGVLPTRLGATLCPLLEAASEANEVGRRGQPISQKLQVLSANRPTGLAAVNRHNVFQVSQGIALYTLIWGKANQTREARGGLSQLNLSSGGNRAVGAKLSPIAV